MSSRIDDLVMAVPDGRLREEVSNLLRRHEELERSNRDLERFAFVACHDLQEPLRVISNYAQLLAQRCSHVLDEEAIRCAHNIAESATRMSAMLADLLAYAKAGALPEPATETADLNAVLETVIRNLKASIEETHAAVTCDPLPVLRAHPNNFIPLFQDLLSNAIKYRSESAPRIHISVQCEGGQLRFAVSDNGVGIDPAYHRQIFEPFKRLHGRNIPGTGLGLAICERVIQQYGGSIWVESKPGDGATFVFTLPDITVSQEPPRKPLAPPVNID